MWVRADMDSYIGKFEIYQGKGTGGCIDGYGLGESVVINLCEGIVDKGRKIFFDSFFTSVPLLTHLADNNTWACGTVRSNRKGLADALAK
ncbi:PiggyBac transposable element-derived protein 3 [Plakobranchus ocellatus]|uniref:PiggyBac transposable element-derived protein 3 n=1 Tax=Plakobranchus ocellatus TaxID=259542 RepID=A0AAV4AIF4_9GAST|nr:PiggyBac transposable element-derived protein 3 [Plakobranchus ocellatus]